MSESTTARDVLLAALVLQGAIVVWYVPYIATDYASGALDLLARVAAVFTGLTALALGHRA